MMRNSGNKPLRELLEVYSIDRFKIDKNILYNSRLLEFYRKLVKYIFYFLKKYFQLKSKVNGEEILKTPPSKEDCLKSYKIDNQGGFNTYDPRKTPLVSKKSKDDNKFASISSENNNNGEDGGFSLSFNGWFSGVVNSTKFLAGKVGELDIGSTIINTGNIFIDKGSYILNKATEASVRNKFFIQKSEKINTFAKKANEGINYLMNKFFGLKKKEPETEYPKNGN